MDRDTERSVVEGAVTANHMCWRGSIDGNMTTLEEAHEACRYTIQGHSKRGLKWGDLDVQTRCGGEMVPRRPVQGRRRRGWLDPKEAQNRKGSVNQESL